MKLSVDPRLPQVDDVPTLRRRLSELFGEIANQVNRISEGAVQGNHNANTAAPATGTYAKGDFVKNSAPAELGVAGSKYVIHGWQCIAAGSPGTWVPCRFLTGN